MEFDWVALEKRFKDGFSEIVDRLSKSYSKIYTSRISIPLFEAVPVFAYGEDMKLKELVNFQISASRTLIIKPYDANILPDIVKALQKSNPEFSPSVQQDHIKITINPPTEESRKKSVKEAKEYLENAKVSVRNLRKEVIDKLKKGDIPEDQEKKYIQQIDSEVKAMNKKLDDVFFNKEKELMTI